jgi:putative CocE/NonD family hydrolase
MVSAMTIAVVLGSQDPILAVKDQYTKYEYMIPMRDGAKLYTSVYVPKDGKEKHPILLERTPYSAGPYGPDQYKGGFRGSINFRKNNYIFAFQDVRGRLMSEGEFEDVRPQLEKGAKGIDESTDTYDTIDYLVKKVPTNNGRVGLWGISYPGFYAGAGCINSHPALKASSPQAPVSDWWVGDDMHHHGVLFLQDSFSFFSGFGQPRPVPTANPKGGPRIDYAGDAYKWYLGMGPLSSYNDQILHGEVRFWNDLMGHESYDAFWKARALPPHMTGIKCAVLVVGGFFDAEDLWGAENLYKQAERLNPKAKINLVMGPWPHGGWAFGTGSRFGDIDLPGEPSNYFREQVEWPFFDAYLRGDGKIDIPEARVYETGSGEWRNYAQWPPKEAKSASLYLSAAKNLTWDPPKVKDGSDSYESDPANPVPYQKGTNIGRTREYMIDDQRFAEARPDVLSYKTEPLTKDVTISGSVTADLWSSLTSTDADFVVKVIDVYPDDARPNTAGQEMAGYQMLVRAEIMRGKFRKDFSNPLAFEPGKAEEVKFSLPETTHKFRKGHRIMIQVQSSWFPLADRNPQKFTNVYQAKSEDYQKATITLWRTQDHPSRVILDVLP